MSVAETRSAVCGAGAIRRRLGDLELRLAAISEEIDANEREYLELRRREEIVLAEHAELRARFNGLVWAA